MSAAVAAAAAAACVSSSYTSSHHSNQNIRNPYSISFLPPSPQQSLPTLSRFEAQKRRDWNTFRQYLKNHRPHLALSRCSGAHVLEFLKYLDQFGETKVHTDNCPFFAHPHPPAPCPCPLRQAWSSLDALVGRLREAFKENGGQPRMNPFGAPAVRLYISELKDAQAKARSIVYEKEKKETAALNSSY